VPVQESSCDHLLLETSAALSAGDVFLTALHGFHSCSRVLAVGGAVATALDLSLATPTGCIAVHSTAQWELSMSQKPQGKPPYHSSLEDDFFPAEAPSEVPLHELGAVLLLRPRLTHATETLAKSVPPLAAAPGDLEARQVMELESWLCHACADHQTLRAIAGESTHSSQASISEPCSQMLHSLASSLQSLLQHLPGCYDTTASSRRSSRGTDTDELQSTSEGSVASSEGSSMSGVSFPVPPTPMVSRLRNSDVIERPASAEFVGPGADLDSGAFARIAAATGLPFLVKALQVLMPWTLVSLSFRTASRVVQSLCGRILRFAIGL
jgi:hypothetical protein